MKRGLNNIEKASIRILNEKGYTVEVIETIMYGDKPCYFAKIFELKIMIDLDTKEADLHAILEKHELRINSNEINNEEL